MYIDIPWKKAIHMILDEPKSLTKPVMIVRQDDLQHGYKIWQYLRVKYKCVYVRMGIVYSMAHLFEEIFAQLQTNQPFKPYDYGNTINKIVAFTKTLQRPVTIVIDNSHYLTLKSICYLLGLITETEGKARFILLMVDKRISEWNKIFSATDPRGKLFFQVIKLKFQLSY